MQNEPKIIYSIYRMNPRYGNLLLLSPPLTEVCRLSLLNEKFVHDTNGVPGIFVTQGRPSKTMGRPGLDIGIPPVKPRSISHLKVDGLSLKTPPGRPNTSDALRHI